MNSLGSGSAHVVLMQVRVETWAAYASKDLPQEKYIKHAINLACLIDFRVVRNIFVKYVSFF